jgi:hypothetical protein
MIVKDEVISDLGTVEVEKGPNSDYKIIMPQMDRNLYVKVNDVLSSLGGKWNRKAKGHLFSEDPENGIADVILTGEVTKVNLKKELQYYPTPPGVLDEIRKLCLSYMKDVGEVYEPSAGEGAIAEMLRETYGDDINLYCFEKHPPFCDTLREKGFEVREGDFLEVDPNLNKADSIIANPPFTKLQDVDHVSHMIDCLYPGGFLCTVMSPAIDFRVTKKIEAFKEKLNTEMEYWDTLEMESGAFKSSGTNVRTIILWGHKGV